MIELWGLDSGFNPINKIKYIELQWNRKYYEFGQFSVQIVANEYDPGMVYVYTKDRPEVGMIQKVERTTNIKGQFIQLSGLFMEKRLDDKVIYPIFTKSGTGEDIARALVSGYKRDMPIILGDRKGLGTSTTLQESNATLGSKLYEFLALQQLSWRIRYDYELNQMYFDVWQGTDRTQDQEVNNPVVFSEGFRNITEATVVMDSSDYKNYAICVGNGDYDDGNQITIYHDESGGGYQKQLFVDMKSTKYDPEKQTRAQYDAILHQECIKKLAEHKNIENMELDAARQPFVYLKDYDLGDKCDIVISSMKKSFQARVIEVLEVHSKNKMDATLVIGDKIPTQYEKARLH